MINEKELIAKLEAVLFAVGEPIELSRIAQGLEINADVVKNGLHILKERYEDESYGICLLRLDDKYQICTKQKFAENIVQEDISFWRYCLSLVDSV